MRKIGLLISVVIAVMLACGGTLLVVGQQAQAAFPGTNGKIAFETNRDGNWEIYSMNADGTEQKNLTNSPPNANLGGASGLDRYPTWSADGKRIAFVSYRDGDYEIYSMNADGTGQTKLTNSTTWELSPAWSPSGDKIAFRSDLGSSNWDVWVMNADGTGKTRLTYGAYAMEMSWSPDGKKLAFASYQGDGNDDIYLMNSDGTGLTRLTDDPAEDRHPDWSPDGTKIAFESNRGGGFRVWTMNADGTGQTPISKDPPSAGASYFNPAWAPDGTKIAFAGASGISVMKPDGTVVQDRLTDGTAENYAPTWQPLPFSYDFSGFFSPVDNPDVLNKAKAGSAIPVKFSLNGDQGLDVFAKAADGSSFPKSGAMACDSTAPVDVIEQTVSASSSGLTYDAGTDSYTYVWKTGKDWTGYRQLVVKLNDGKEYRANFKFIK